jgi:lipopolysaccharide export system permease protein
MRRLDRLILSEMAGPWAFGVAIFTVLIMAGSFLFELTRYITEGINPVLVGQLTVLLLPGIMAKTFPMAVLLAGLLAFGRLSGDSEIVAIKAAGVSVGRIMWPVAAFGLAVSIATYLVNEQLVPAATQHAVGLKKRFEADIKGKTAQEMSQAVYKDGRLAASFWAADFDFSKRTLSRVVVTV